MAYKLFHKAKYWLQIQQIQFALFSFVVLKYFIVQLMARAAIMEIGLLCRFMYNSKRIHRSYV